MADETQAAAVAPIEFRSVTDMHQVPVDKLQAFTTDLALWLQMHRLSEEHGVTVVTPRDVFGWLDDGRHDVTVRVDVTHDETARSLLGVDAKKPTYCRCAKCQHVWVAVYVPIAAETFARICKRVTCPMCGEVKQLFLYEPGRMPETV